MIKCKAGDVWAAAQALGKLQRIEKVPVKVAYRVSRLVKRLESEYKECEEARRKLVDQYGSEVMDKEGKPTGSKQVTEPLKLQAYSGELQKLFDEEIEVQADVVELPGFVEGLSAADLNALESFVAEAKE